MKKKTCVICGAEYIVSKKCKRNPYYCPMCQTNYKIHKKEKA